MREVKVKISRACSACDGHGRVYMKQADRDGNLIPGGTSEWYNCPTCHNKAEERFFEEWITLSELKELLEPGMKKDASA